MSRAVGLGLLLLAGGGLWWMNRDKIPALKLPTLPTLPALPGPGPSGLDTQAVIARAIAAARAQIGKEYEWGAEGPDKFDCSGLMYFAWNQAGVIFPRTTAQGLLARSKSVPVDQLRPGDMVFFGPSETDVNHVGLYLGGDRMVHAPRGGTLVQEGSIRWRSLLRGGRLVG